MRILWLTENYYPNKGGMAQSCDRIVYGLRSLAVYVDVIHFVRKPRRRPLHQLSYGRDLRWPLHDHPSHGLRTCWTWVSQQDAYDVVVAFGCQYALIAAQTYAGWLGAKLVTMVRGNDFDTGVFDLKRRALLKDVYESSALVISVSQDKVELIRSLFPKVEVTCIPNGIDLEQWQVLPSQKKQAQALVAQKPETRVCLGLFGQLKEKKGGGLFIDAVLKSGVAKRLHLLFVGEIPAEIQSKLSAHEDVLSFSVYPFMDRSQLVPYYLSCDYVVIPSFYDGMPNVLLEAGALAIPIIAANTGGMADVIEHEGSGLLFEPGNERALSALLKRVVSEDHHIHQAWGKRLGQKIYQEFDSKFETQAYQRCFKKLLVDNSSE